MDAACALESKATSSLKPGCEWLGQQIVGAPQAPIPALQCQMPIALLHAAATVARSCNLHRLHDARCAAYNGANSVVSALFSLACLKELRDLPKLSCLRLVLSTWRQL
jgi:hypothetical protein